MSWQGDGIPRHYGMTSWCVEWGCILYVMACFQIGVAPFQHEWAQFFSELLLCLVEIESMQYELTSLLIKQMP